MRLTHGLDAGLRVEPYRKSNDVPAVLQPFKERHQMFVRAVWRQQPLVDPRPIQREIGAPPKRNVDILGVSAPDFPRMTRGLFDRQG
jgi:hypothetical protein